MSEVSNCKECRFCESVNTMCEQLLGQLLTEKDCRLLPKICRVSEPKPPEENAFQGTFRKHVADRGGASEIDSRNMSWKKLICVYSTTYKAFLDGWLAGLKEARKDTSEGGWSVIVVRVSVIDDLIRQAEGGRNE